MFENLLLLGWLEILLIVLASIGVCTGIILLMDIWMNREWTPVIKAKKIKTIEIGRDEQGNPVYQSIEYLAVIDWGTASSIVSGILLGIFYSIAALIGLGEVVLVTDMFGDITNIWTIRIVPIILCVFVGFFSNAFWKVIYWIEQKVERKIEDAKQKDSQTVAPPKTAEPQVAIEIPQPKIVYGKSVQSYPPPQTLQTPVVQPTTAPAEKIVTPETNTTQAVQELLEDKPIDNQL